jgi:hypothetical protein
MLRLARVTRMQSACHGMEHVVHAGISLNTRFSVAFGENVSWCIVFMSARQAATRTTGMTARFMTCATNGKSRFVGFRWGDLGVLLIKIEWFIDTV